MSKQTTNFFWPGFTDLMTSLFFIMLVLYVLTFLLLRQQQQDLKVKVKDLERKLNVFELVEKNLAPIKKDSSGLFRYEHEYKRFVLAFDVNFRISEYTIQPGSLENSAVTLANIRKAGRKLRDMVDSLVVKRERNPEMKKVSYLLIISGSSSHLATGSEINDYELSYRRAYHLREYWKMIGIDFESADYKDIIDLQIAGNGWGGIGRFERDLHKGFSLEKKNQRFIIQIVPKIGDAQ